MARTLPVWLPVISTSSRAWRRHLHPTEGMRMLTARGERQVEKAEESQLLCAAPGGFVGSEGRCEELHIPSWPGEHQDLGLSVEMLDQEFQRSSAPKLSLSCCLFPSPHQLALLLTSGFSLSCQNCFFLLSLVAGAVPLLRSRPAPGTLKKGLNHL